MTPDSVTQMRDHMNRLRGRLFGAIEAVGMPERQENAMKGLVRQLSYDAQADLEECLTKAHKEPHA